MFCGCRVVDALSAPPNDSVCPVCLGQPGALPVVNRIAVELGLKAALALECTPLPTSIFARKNYFYPDLPKGYQISQYETPLAEHGRLVVHTASGEKEIRIRRVHLEEDTGKLTHLNREVDPCTLVDLNRAGVPLLEIVTEPDMNSVEQARAYAATLQQLLRYLNVSSADMEKGAIRFEANVSVMPAGSSKLGTRTEIKNLNSFRSMERAIAYEISRQIKVLEGGGSVLQETVGWNENEGVTFSQRGKEEAHDYRYFPEPDLPPLVVEHTLIESIRADMPELPAQKEKRLIGEYGIEKTDAETLTSDFRIAAYFEELIRYGAPVKQALNWIFGPLFQRMNASGSGWGSIPVPASNLAELIQMADSGRVNLPTARTIFNEMAGSGRKAVDIAAERGLTQIRDDRLISGYVREVLEGNPRELAGYLAGKETLAQWFFGQVMAKTRGQASPAVVKAELEKQLAGRKEVKYGQ